MAYLCIELLKYLFMSTSTTFYVYFRFNEDVEDYEED